MGKKGIKHLLLVGDASITPVRYMVLDRATPAAFDYAFYTSDLYYADLAKRDGSFDSPFQLEKVGKYSKSKPTPIGKRGILNKRPQISNLIAGRFEPKSILIAINLITAAFALSSTGLSVTEAFQVPSG